MSRSQRDEELREQRAIAELDAIIDADKQLMETLGRVVATMLAEKEPITLDSLIACCSRFHAEFGRRMFPEKDPCYTCMPSLIRKLEGLKEST